MADTFTPRGAPVPANSYDGWELTHRPTMLPFLAEYTNQQGETAGGWAMPNMVTEPVNALFRLMNTPAGTMPDPRDSQNQSDALTGLMALYGGNAVGGVARNAMSRGVAMGRPNMEAARPVAYSNAIDEAMSNPNMLRMMDDINYADLNRRALDQYGVGYEGVNSSQEAKLRGWSDPSTFFADTGKPNPAGAALAGNKPNADVMASYGLRDGPLAPAIAKAISDPGEFYYGIRTTPYKIEPGQIMPNSTEWFQDANPLPWSELLSSEQKVVRDYYPELSLDELNAMKFDPDYLEHGKPLNGSSAIEMFGPNKAPTLDDIERARRYQIYGTNGDFVHLVRSRARPERGYDLGEWIIPGAEVVSVAPFGNNLFSNASPLAGWLASGANALAQSEEQSPGDFIPHR